ncbi:MAG: hypothetical protein FWF76_00610 [Oscillospiraceae bacterium]|nr:hypothetical protein [Oscillospiraceae bacterium]
MKNTKFHKDEFKHLDALRKLRLEIDHAFFKLIYGEDDGFFKLLVEDIKKMNKREENAAFSGREATFDYFFPFESPDAYFLHGDTVIGIEHFQFDSYKTKKGKGSEGRRDEIFAQSDIDMEYNEIRKTGKRGTIELSRDVTTPMSIQNYQTNLLNGFNQHYNRIADYKKNLLSCVPQAKDVKICFYIEDATPMGNYYVSTGSVVHEPPFRIEYMPPSNLFSLEPLRIKEFVDLLKDSTNIDYLICSLKYRHHSSIAPLGLVHFFRNCKDGYCFLPEVYNNKYFNFYEHEYTHKNSISNFGDIADGIE